MILRNCLIFAVLMMLALPSIYGRGNRDSTDSSRIGAGEISDGVINEEVDYLGIAALMVRDGAYDRAATALLNIDPQAEETDLVRYHTLSGLVAMYYEDYKAAAASFESAVAHGQSDPLIHAYLGQIYFARGEYRRSLDALSNLTNFDQYPDLLGIKSQAHWRLGEVSPAISTLEDAISLYPDRSRFYQQRIFYLIELDLTREAVDQSLLFLSSLGTDPVGYITIGEALRRGNQHNEAIIVLEMAKLKFPENNDIYLSLAQAYLDAERFLTAADIVETVSHHDGTYYYDAAELYRRAGRYRRALYLNGLISDPVVKASQRFTILLEMKRYEEALALEARLRGLGLLEDDTLRYALAYVNYQAGHYDRSLEYINQIIATELVDKATRLKSAIELTKSREFLYF